MIVTPAALSWSFVYGTYYSALTHNVGLLRLQSNYSLGTPNSEHVEVPEHKKSTAPSSEIEQAKAKLFIHSRIHGNFIEQVTLPFIMLTLAELNGAPTMLVSSGFAILFIGRLFHAHGMKQKGSLGVTRLIATLSTITLNIITGAYNVYLARDFLKDIVGL